MKNLFAAIFESIRRIIEQVVDTFEKHPARAWWTFFVLALAPRILAPSGIFINFDAAGKWIERTKAFLEGVTTLSPALLVQAPHPGVPLMWLMSIGEWFNQHGHVYRIFSDPAVGYITVLKIPLLLATSALAASLFLFLRGLVTTRFATIITLIWCFEPIYLAFSRYLHLDGLLTGLFILIAVGLWRARLETRWKWTIITGVLIGIASLTRLNIIPSIIITALMAGFARLGDWRRWWLRLAALLAVSVVAMAVIWPPVVTRPAYVKTYIQRGIKLGTSPHEVPYRIDRNPIVSRLLYPIFLGSRTWTWVVVLCIIAAPIIFWRMMRRRTRDPFSAYLLGAAISVLLVLLYADKKLDRYAAPAVGPMLIIACLMLREFHKQLRWQARKSFVILVVGVISLGLIDLWRFAPYYQLYENEIGLLLRQSKALRTSAAFSRGWGEGYYETARYLESLGWPRTAVRNSDTLCTHRTPDDSAQFPFHPTKKSSCARTITGLPNAARVNYLAISSATFDQNVYPRLLGDIRRLGWQPVKVIALKGIPMVYIYRNTGGLSGTYLR